MAVLIVGVPEEIEQAESFNDFGPQPCVRFRLRSLRAKPDASGRIWTELCEASREHEAVLRDAGANNEAIEMHARPLALRKKDGQGMWCKLLVQEVFAPVKAAKATA